MKRELVERLYRQIFYLERQIDNMKDTRHYGTDQEVQLRESELKEKESQLSFINEILDIVLGETTT